MIALAALLGIGASEPVPPPGLPPIIQAFQRVCGGTSTIDQVAERALAAGWTEQAPAAGSQFALIVDMMRSAGAPPGDRTFTGVVEGRRLHAWVRETIPAPMGTFIECKVYDFAPAHAPAIIADAIAWQGRPPSADIGPLGNGMHAVAWEGPNGSIVGAGVEVPSCQIIQDCSPRVVVEQSVTKED